MYERIGTDELGRGYLLRYMREQDGLLTIDCGDGAAVHPDNPPDYTPPWPEEYIEIFVDQNGVQMFCWDSPAEVTEIVSNNVALLPFDQFHQRIKAQLKYKFIWMDEAGYEMKTEVEVTRIVLGLAMISIKDNTEEALLVPAWYVLYDQFDDYGDEDRNSQGYSMVYEDALVINAIDGSIIEPRVVLS